MSIDTQSPILHDTSTNTKKHYNDFYSSSLLYFKSDVKIFLEIVNSFSLLLFSHQFSLKIFEAYDDLFFQKDILLCFKDHEMNLYIKFSSTLTC